jgi:hypothetical protein
LRAAPAPPTLARLAASARNGALLCISFPPGAVSDLPRIAQVARGHLPHARGAQERPPGLPPSAAMGSSAAPLRRLERSACTRHGATILRTPCLSAASTPRSAAGAADAPCSHHAPIARTPALAVGRLRSSAPVCTSAAVLRAPPTSVRARAMPAYRGHAGGARDAAAHSR